MLLHPQTVSSKAGRTISQKDRAVCTQAVSSQVVSSQAINTNSQGDSVVPPQAGSHSVECTDDQLASASPQPASTNSQGVSAASQQACS